MIKLVATDMDGTLLNAEGKFSQITREAVKKVISKGIIFAASSGRLYSNLNDIFLKYDSNMILVCNNGAWVQRAGNGQVLGKSIIPLERIREFIRYVNNRKGIYIFLCTGDTAIIDNTDEYVINSFIRSKINYIVVDDLLTFNQDICRIGLRLTHDVDKEELEDIARRFSETFEVTYGGKRWMDFMNPGITKGHGVEIIQKLYGIKPEETMVFGDYYNDIGMFKKAYYSYAMGQAPEEVKSHANFVAMSNDEDGVAAELLKLCV